MEPIETGSLWSAISAGVTGQFLQSPATQITLSGLRTGSAIKKDLRELEGRSVLLATREQLSSAVALLELDGVARRLVLCPPDFSIGNLAAVVETADIDAIVSDQDADVFSAASVPVVQCGARFSNGGVSRARARARRTEWVLFTSGTTGRPKMAVHTLSGLTGAIKRTSEPDRTSIWATFYDIRRYGGLQIFLRAMIGNRPLVLSGEDEPLSEHLDRLARCGVTHITGTPSHWRRVLMSPAAQKIAPQYVRLSGEIADQGILDGLQALYPKARIVHAYASTEAGVGFEVHDGLEGFPSGLLEEPGRCVGMRVKDGTLRIRSNRAALRYLSNSDRPITQDDGYVDTGDLVELRGERYYFAGRKDGVINVGGQKVNPEEVEAVINRHPRVQMSLVSAKKSPIIGSIVVADVVVKDPLLYRACKAHSPAALESEIRAMCTQHLARHKVPAMIRFVTTLKITPGGKLARQHA